MIHNVSLIMPVELSRRVIPTGMKRVAATDAPDTLEGTDDRPVLADCPDEIMAASGIKSALPTKNGTQEDLIQTHAADEKSCEQ